MTRPPSIPADLWDQIPATLLPAIAAVVDGLETQVATLTARVAQLEALLNQNSSNSSKPPSSDGPQVKPAPSKTPSQRKRGGQPGHPKHDRVLLPPDEVIEHKPTQCRACQTTLIGDDPQPIVDQVVELPTKLRHVTHHRRHTLTCPCCCVRTTAAPVPDTRAGFGPRLTAVTAYLSGVGRLGKRTIRTLFADVLGIPVSLGVVSKHEAVVSRALEPIHAQAHAHAKGLDANVDETGWKQGRTKAWLWVAVTNLLTVFLIRPKRNRLAFDDLVGPKPGILTTDRFSVYTHLGDQRQVCWAHLRRDFQAMIDRKNDGSVIGKELLAQSELLFVHWQKVRTGPGLGGGSTGRIAGNCVPRSASSWNAGPCARASRRRRCAGSCWGSRRVCGRSRV